ncbi:hypothetical protein V6N12_061443 [Hibiscus sabdariffa]|uniref:Uncharacterized protein n=1 Tax=Hibiscus sabdariffa TaxID=183260 RepID=A0ABR2DX26_9ROSI
MLWRFTGNAAGEGQKQRALQPVLPCLKSMTWVIENKNSTPGNRVAVINLKLQDYGKIHQLKWSVLAGLLKNRVFHITTLIIPKQESTSDSCSTLNEEEIFEVQDKLSLFPLGWIHVDIFLVAFCVSSFGLWMPESLANWIAILEVARVVYI